MNETGSKWWPWVKGAFYYLVTIFLLLAIYTQVIETRFECLIFSVVALIYFELVAQNSGWIVELLQERDHRNEIHRLLSARLGAPIDQELDKGIDELKSQTEKAASHHLKHNLARLPLILIILWNLCRAVFFW